MKALILGSTIERSCAANCLITASDVFLADEPTARRAGALLGRARSGETLDACVAATASPWRGVASSMTIRAVSVPLGALEARWRVPIWHSRSRVAAHRALGDGGERVCDASGCQSASGVEQVEGVEARE